MNGEKRLTAAELMDEIRSSLTMTDGWIPALSGSDGPAGLLENASLAEVAQRLQEFADAPTLPASVVDQLRRAAESATAAVTADSSTAYSHLGAAYAYVLQAHRAASASL
jgi:uncharacterized alpha-E superfamily protein